MASKPKLVDKDRGWLRFLQVTRSLERGAKRLEVGVLAGTDKGGDTVPGTDLTYAELSAVLEFGTEDGHIPARPVVRAMFDLHRERITAMFASGIGSVFDSKRTVTEVFDEIGEFLAKAMQDYIVHPIGPPPPNADATIAEKGFDHPWVKTGELVKAFSWRAPGYPGVGKSK